MHLGQKREPKVKVHAHVGLTNATRARTEPNLNLIGFLCALGTNIKGENCWVHMSSAIRLDVSTAPEGNAGRTGGKEAFVLLSEPSTHISCAFILGKSIVHINAQMGSEYCIA